MLSLFVWLKSVVDAGTDFELGTEPVGDLGIPSGVDVGPVGLARECRRRRAGGVGTVPEVELEAGSDEERIWGPAEGNGEGSPGVDGVEAHAAIATAAVFPGIVGMNFLEEVHGLGPGAGDWIERAVVDRRRRAVGIESRRTVGDERRRRIGAGRIRSGGRDVRSAHRR